MMKNLSALLFACLICLSLSSRAAAQEGIVTYEEVIKVNIELPPEMEHMRDQIPSSNTATRLLYFNEAASILKNAPEETDEVMESHGHGGMVRFQMGGAENETYTNFEEDRQIQKREFMGRTFLIAGKMSDLSWRLSEERSEFLGYMCQKATAQRDSTTYEAWFTPEINIPAGPDAGGLPGLILVLNIDGDQRSYVAKDITLRALEKGVISPPKKGKKVTVSEFDEIVAEKMKEMNASGGGNNFIIRRRNND